MDNFTWRLGDAGVVLNDDPGFVGDTFVDITEAKGFDNAPIRQANHDHEGTDGGFVDAEFETTRAVALNGTAYATNSTIMTYLDALKANWAPSSTPIPLYMQWPGQSQRVLFVKPLGCQYDLSTAIRTGTTEIQFQALAEDPRFYDATLITVNIPLSATVFTGFSFPFSFPFSFGGTNQIGDGRTVINFGNRDTPALLRINGPATNPTVISDTADATMKFQITLGATDYLLVDTGSHTVRLNGTANRRNTLQAPDWFMLATGGNFIRFQADSGSAGSVDVMYRSAWR